MSTARRPRGPTDPERASRIARATIEVLKLKGLTGMTHRAVAAEAGVPLGSTTYHFASRDELLEAAMVQLISEHEELIAAWALDLNVSNAVSRLASLLEGQSTPGAGRRRLLVEYELYLAAVRAPHLRELSRRWDGVLSNVLQQRLGQQAGRLYFAAYNGFVLESLISEAPLNRVEIEESLSAIAVLVPFE